MLQSSRYEAFGAKTGETGTVANKYLFAGEQYDSNLGDYYLRARYYDTNVGRFTRRDTYEGTLQAPITLHKYLYGNDNPINCVDPSGYLTLGQLLVGFVIADILWQAVNPFNFGGIDVASDTLFSAIDPTRGLGGQINFDPIYDFVKECILYRSANQISRSRNVAVVQFRDTSGKLRLRATENITSSEAGIAIHAEQALTGEITALGIPRSNITRIYSEFEPCNFGDNNCALFLKSYFPNAQVYWSYPYNNIAELEFSRQRKYLDLENYGISHK